MTFLRWGSWAVLALVTVELCAREVARRSLFEILSGTRPDLGPLTTIAIACGIAGVLASRGSTGRRTAVIFATLFAVGVASQIHLGARLQSDGFYYFSYLRSLVFDRDVEFSNDYRLLGLGDKAHLFQPTPTGYAQSAWTIGPAIVWSPFFAAAHPIARALNRQGADVSTNGISYPYRQAVCIAGLFYALLGCWFMYRLVLRFFDTRLSVLAVVLVVAGSFMLWYAVREPSMTHAPSMAGVAGFAWFWVATYGRRTRFEWALLGFVAGFITLIRWQNALFAILPASESLALLVGAVRTKNTRLATDALINGALFTLLAVVGFIPQMLAWKSIYGSYLAVSPVGPQIRWWDPHLVDILWSSRNGLFSWSPILYVGAIGLLLFACVRPAIGVPCVVAVAVMTYFNASIQDWWGSDGFGGRRFEGTLPLFALGVAAFADRAAAAARRHPLRVVAAGGALLVLWNLSLMSAAHDGHVRIGESISFGEAAAHQARAIHRWFGHPFTYPASLFFAARNDVPIGAYDLLAANRFLSDPLRPYGRIDVGGPGDDLFLDGGWHGPEASGPTTFRWTDATAGMLIPLDYAATLRVQIHAQPFQYQGAPPQTVRLVINGTAGPEATLEPGWTTTVLEVDERFWRAGVNRVQLAFGRATRPAEVGGGSDIRMLAAAVNWVRVSVVSPE